MTYQAISGGGAKQMRELLAQMGDLNAAVVEYRETKAILTINRDITARKRSEEQLLHEALHDALKKGPHLPARVAWEDGGQHAGDWQDWFNQLAGVK